jgi:hypothetical protein
MSNDKYGERVNLGQISDAPLPGTLPHPQDPWGTAQPVSTPFSNTAPSQPAGGPGRAVLYDPMFEAQQRAQAQKTAAAQPAPAPAPAPAAAAPVELPKKRAVPAVKPASQKETAILQKFKRVFGLARIDVIEGTVLRRDPDDANKNIEMRFGFRGLNPEDYQWALEKTGEIQHNVALIQFAWKAACVSIGTASMDGIPIWEALGFEPESPAHVADPMYPHIGLRFAAAEAFCELLNTSLYDTVESLYSLYEQKIDMNYFPKPKEDGEKEGPLPETESAS